MSELTDSYGIIATKNNVLQFKHQQKNIPLIKRKPFPYPLSNAVNAATSYIREESNDEDLSRVVRQYIRLLIRLHDHYYHTAQRNRKSKAISKLRLLPLYKANQKTEGNLVADLNPIRGNTDPDFKSTGDRSSVLLSSDDRRDLAKLKEIYNLPSEAATIVHVIFIAMTLIRDRRKYHLYTHFDFPISEEAEDGSERTLSHHL